MSKNPEPSHRILLDAAVGTGKAKRTTFTLYPRDLQILGKLVYRFGLPEDRSNSMLIRFLLRRAAEQFLI